MATKEVVPVTLESFVTLVEASGFQRHEVEEDRGRLTLDVLRAFVASTGQVPGDARVVVRTSDDQRDGASFTLKVTFEGAPS